MVKNTVNFFVRENKFHPYLTHETLPAEEKVSIIDDHRKTSFYQTFADGSMRKGVLSGQSRAHGHVGYLSAVYLLNNDPWGNRLISRATDYGFTLGFLHKAQSRATGNTADT